MLNIMANGSFIIRSKKMNTFLDLLQLVSLVGAVVFMILAVLSVKGLL